MSFDVRAVANYLLDKADSESMPLDHMKLQKLVYIAHGWHLAINDKPLFDNRVEAWPYGPVIPDLYHVFKKSGTEPIQGRARGFAPYDGDRCPYTLEASGTPEDSVQATKAVLDRVWERYKCYDALQLSGITHQEGTPWFEVAGKLPPQIVRNIVIPNDLIQRHYLDLVTRKRAHARRAG